MIKKQPKIKAIRDESNFTCCKIFSKSQVNKEWLEENCECMTCIKAFTFYDKDRNVIGKEGCSTKCQKYRCFGNYYIETWRQIK